METEAKKRLIVIMELSNDQKYALDTLKDWFKSSQKSQFITLGGFAGTGKSTLISILRKDLSKDNQKLKVAFCSFTGKASQSLNSKINENGSFYPKDSVSTIHSLIYTPSVNMSGDISAWDIKEKLDFDLIIVDEASMVDTKIWNDLLSFKIPIIAVGDHGQLPPISSNFNLMQKPKIKLEEIHRQAKNNPIINLSMFIRNEGYIPAKKFGINVEKKLRSEDGAFSFFLEKLEDFNENTLVLCGFNKTRIKLNNHIRSFKEIEGFEPTRSDIVICLKNNRNKNIFNGLTGRIKSIEPHSKSLYYAEIDMIDRTYKGLISKNQFNSEVTLEYKDLEVKQNDEVPDLFDFGYALTVHKAQGSQAKRVLLFEERSKHMDDDKWKRWLYTAVTRAEEEIFILGD